MSRALAAWVGAFMLLAALTPRLPLPWDLLVPAAAAAGLVALGVALERRRRRRAP